MRRFPRKSARDSFNTQHFLKHTPTHLPPGSGEAPGIWAAGTPHPLGAASPPPPRRRTVCPTHPFCLALSASPRRLLSLGAITCDFLVTDAVRFPGPDEAGSWGGSTPSLLTLSGCLPLPFNLQMVIKATRSMVQLQHF